LELVDPQRLGCENPVKATFATEASMRRLGAAVDAAATTAVVRGRIVGGMHRVGAPTPDGLPRRTSRTVIVVTAGGADPLEAGGRNYMFTWRVVVARRSGGTTP
jgi:hypothetical protein